MYVYVINFLVFPDTGHFLIYGRLVSMSAPVLQRVTLSCQASL